MRRPPVYPEIHESNCHECKELAAGRPFLASQAEDAGRTLAAAGALNRLLRHAKNGHQVVSIHQNLRKRGGARLKRQGGAAVSRLR